MKPRCPYCAHAPVPHWAQWIIGTVDALAAMGRRVIERSFLARAANRCTKSMRPVVQTIERLVMGALAHTPLVRVSRTAHKEGRLPTGRVRVIWEEADRRGIRIESLTILGKTTEECRARIPRSTNAKNNWESTQWFYFQALPIPPWLQSSGWVEDKWEMKRRFAAAGLPVASGKTVVTERQAVRAAQVLGWPVIVKPREGSRARHTFLNIQDEAALRAAFKGAQQLGAFVLVETYIPGDTYRATCVNGKLIAVMRFHKPSIEADGVRSCNELREAYNAAIVYKGVSPVADTPWFTLALSRQNLTPESIPPQGTRVILAEHSERTNGGVNEDVTNHVPAATRAMIEQAASLAGCAVIGFDIVSTDLHAIHFIEGNTLPFIDIHHDPTIGASHNVAGAVWDLWTTKENKSS